jgi:hypothetical protein
MGVTSSSTTSAPTSASTWTTAIIMVRGAATRPTSSPSAIISQAGKRTRIPAGAEVLNLLRKRKEIVKYKMQLENVKPGILFVFIVYQAVLEY